MKEQCCCSPVSYQKVKLEATQNWQRAVSGPENLKGLLGVKGKSLQLFFSPLLAPTNGNLCKCKERSDSGLSTTFWYPGTKALSRLKMRGEKNPTKLAAVECAVLFWNMDVEGQEYHLLSVYRNADSTPLYLCSQQSWGEVLSPMIQNWTLDRSIHFFPPCFLTLSVTTRPTVCTVVFLSGNFLLVKLHGFPCLAVYAYPQFCAFPQPFFHSGVQHTGKGQGIGGWGLGLKSSAFCVTVSGIPRLRKPQFSHLYDEVPSVATSLGS